MPYLHGCDFYLFRRPLLSVETLLELLEKSATEDSLSECLVRLFREQRLQEAIYLASPSLHQQTLRWLNGEAGFQSRKLLTTLLKYVIRASTRCTPFGLFAGGTSIGQSGSRTNISFRGDRPYRTHSRLDMAFVHELLQRITGDALLREQLTYYANNSIYDFGDNYRYTYLEKQSRQYSICSVEASYYLKAIIEAARQGATFSQLAASIASDEITLQEAGLFVHQLINEQILVDHLQPTVHGPEPLDTLIAQLAALPRGHHWAGRLSEARQVLAGTENQVTKGEKVRDLVAGTGGTPPAYCPIQTDVYFNTAANTIGQGALDALQGTLTRLLCLNQGIYLADLTHFKKKFRERYEGREVPLLKALDGETGIGYNRTNDSAKGYLPLLECLRGSEPAKKSDVEWNFWKEFLMEKYSDALLHGLPEIELTDKDIAYLDEKTTALNQPLPAACVAVGNLLAESAEAVDQGDFLFNLYAMSGPSTANLLSRFCHGDPALYHQMQRYLQAEEQADPHVIFAEIVHLPEPRAGNILLRPVLRQYQIPYLTPGGAPDASSIALSDLMVSVCEKEGVILRSKSLNKRVIPRLTSAHDFSAGLEVYRFLCDLQYDQAVLNVTWHWSILEKRKYLPRVRYRNVILSRATWTIRAEQYPGFQQTGADLPALAANLQATLRMPRYVALSKGDNEILLDLENKHCLEILREELGKDKQITLKEFLQLPGQCLLGEGDKRYTNEIIMPFRVEGSTPLSGQPMPASDTDTGPDRIFSVGSEWLYFKIYTGEKTADLLLKNVCKELCEESLAAGFIDSWFFVRYADPEFHLRVRMHSSQPRRVWQHLIPRLQAALQPYLQQELVLKIQLDTYVREIERYGQDTMVPSEELFFHDSQAVLSWLRQISGDGDEQSRWQFALCSVDALLHDFDFSLLRKLRLIQRLGESYEAEFQLTPDERKQLNQQYRQESPNITKAMRGGLETMSATTILAERSRNSAGTVRTIKALAGANEAALDKLVASYVHMSLNRLFISNPRQHELIIYFYLSRYYTSQAALQKAALPA